MFETAFPSVAGWLSGPNWRLSTWWPSDSYAAKQRSLLRLLAIAHQQRLDVIPLVAHLAQEHRGVYRFRLRRLARRLAEGTPLIDALEQTPDVLTDDDVLAIRFATGTGTLSSAYPQLLERTSQTIDRTRARLRQTIAYFVGLFVFIVAVSAFLISFIVPVLNEMYHEFEFEQSGHQLPWTYRVWIDICDFISDFASLLILAAIVLAALVWLPQSRRFFRRHVARRWAGGFAQTRSAELLRLLSMAVEAGRPLPAALSTLARYHFDGRSRGRLLFARNEVEQGADVWDSLVAAQLLSPAESKAIVAASSAASRVWTMRRLAAWKQDQWARRSETLVAMLHPILVLLFAAIVLLVASAMIHFLTSLIQQFA